MVDTWTGEVIKTDKTYKGVFELWDDTNFALKTDKKLVPTGGVLFYFEKPTLEILNLDPKIELLAVSNAGNNQILFRSATDKFMVLNIFKWYKEIHASSMIKVLCDVTPRIDVNVTFDGKILGA
jgi:hypothetical protein